MSIQENDSRGTQNVPIPDPSTLTTAAILREYQHQKESLENQIKHLADLTNQRFISVEKLFEASDRAVSAALAAAEKAVLKSEMATGRQLQDLMTLISTADKARDAQIRAVEDRVGRSEGKGEGKGELWGWIIGALAVAVAIVVAVTSR